MRPSSVNRDDGGLGALADADVDEESARLKALQVRQQSANGAPPLNPQAPQTLSSLFKG